MGLLCGISRKIEPMLHSTYHHKETIEDSKTSAVFAYTVKEGIHICDDIDEGHDFILTDPPEYTTEHSEINCTAIRVLQ